MAGLALARRAKQLAFWSAMLGLLGSAAGLAYVRFLCSRYLYIRRVVIFSMKLGPIVMHYNWASRDKGTEEEREERVKRLHKRYAPVVCKVIGELRGLFTKAAQVASITPNLLPDEYRREFQTLQNDTKQAQWLAVRGVVEEDLGAPIAQVFERFEREPLGCASIGQAHLAVWQGRQIVLKVQFPDAADNIRADFDCMEWAARMNKKDKDGFALKWAKRIRKQFETELDYRHEAENLQAIHDCVNAAPEFVGKVFVPAPIPELCRGRVLAMDYVPGPKLADIFVARLRALGMDALANTLVTVAKAMGETPMDSNGPETPGAGGEATASLGEQKVVTPEGDGMPPVNRTFEVLSKYLGLRSAVVITAVLAELRLICLRCRGRLAPGSTTAELKARLHLLVHLQGFQIFFCPCFQGDPHPGNFLAVPDGRVGLIDFGQCLVFDAKVKLGFANFIVALNRPETPETNALIAAILRSMGVRTARGDGDYLAFIGRWLLTSYKPEWMRDNVWAYMTSRDTVLEQPTEIFFISRCAGLLRGFGMFINENLDLARAWQPWAERWLRENGEPLEPRPLDPDRKW